MTLHFIHQHLSIKNPELSKVISKRNQLWLIVPNKPQTNKPQNLLISLHQFPNETKIKLSKSKPNETKINNLYLYNMNLKDNS